MPMLSPFYFVKFRDIPVTFVTRSLMDDMRDVKSTALFPSQHRVLSLHVLITRSRMKIVYIGQNKLLFRHVPLRIYFIYAFVSCPR